MEKREASDRELLRATRGGDGPAFGVFYRRRRDLVLAFLARRTSSRELAADLLARDSRIERRRSRRAAQLVLAVALAVAALVASVSLLGDRSPAHPGGRAAQSAGRTSRARQRHALPRRRGARRELHVPINVTLQRMPADWYASLTRHPAGSSPPSGAIKGVYYSASISFKALSATGGRSRGYSLRIGKPRCGKHVRTVPGLVVGSGLNDLVLRASRPGVRRGVLDFHAANVFGGDVCGRPKTIEVLYRSGSGPGAHDVVVGRTALRAP